MSRFRFIVFFLAGFLLAASAWQPPQPASPELKAMLWEAFTRRVEQLRPGESLTFALFTPELDEAFLSPDGTAAVLWLALRDDTGRRLASEPGMVLAVLRSGEWQAILPGDPDWEQSLAAIPINMLPADGPAEVAGTAPGLCGYYPLSLFGAGWKNPSAISRHLAVIPPAEAYCR